MNRIEIIESFLQLIVEIIKNEIIVDPNLVYSNLININTKKEDVSHYVKLLQKDFITSPKMDIVQKKSWCYFSSFGKKANYNKIKIYIPLDKAHIYNGVCELLTFLSTNNISHVTKVSNTTRIDDVIVIVDDILSAEKIRKFVEGNNNIKEGLLTTNPFMYTNGNISFICDGYLSYNMVVAEIVSDYINKQYLEKKLEEVSYIGLIRYIDKLYNDVFEKGIGINKFIESRNLSNVFIEMANYKWTVSTLQSILNMKFSLKDFSNQYRLLETEVSKAEIEKIKKMVFNEKIDIKITEEQKEVFDYAYITISKTKSEEYAIRLFKMFSKEGDYRIFPRKNRIRELMINSKITPVIMRKLMYEEMKTALVNASVETIRKYDVVQLCKALSGIKEGDYSSFTNEKNARNNLKLMVKDDEIDSLLEKIVIENECSSNSVDDSFWLFIELVNKNMVC